MMSKNDKMFDHTVGAIRELPERIGTLKRGGQFVNCPYALVFSAPPRANLFCFGSPGLK
jgi:hypothetical protein